MLRLIPVFLSEKKIFLFLSTVKQNNLFISSAVYTSKTCNIDCFKKKEISDTLIMTSPLTSFFNDTEWALSLIFGGLHLRILI